MYERNRLLPILLLYLLALVHTPGWGQVAASPQVAPTNTSGEAAEPIDISWYMLIDIELEPKFSEEWNTEIYSPILSEEIKALHGKDVLIQGYVIPFDDQGKVLALSGNPYASCFFCGMASHASVASLYLRNEAEGKRFRMDDFKRFRATLLLNPDDPNDYYYILQDARVVE